MEDEDQFYSPCVLPMCHLIMLDFRARKNGIVTILF